MILPAEVTFVSAVVIGLLGSTHCVGMCGGVAGMLAAGVRPSARAQHRWRAVAHVMFYNAGRIASYVTAGALVGGLGGQALGALPQATAHNVGVAISSLFLVALGLYLGGWWPVLAVLERQGARLWRHIEPLARRLLPVRGLPQALAVGLAWGWLPCGLVYSALAWSLSSGSAGRGAVLMLGFGLGTLPVVSSLGAIGGLLKRLSRERLARQLAAVVVLVLGMFGLSSLVLGQLHHHAARTGPQANVQATSMQALLYRTNRLTPALEVAGGDG